MRRSRTSRMPGATIAASALVALLIAHAPSSEAQVAPINFPDTPVGSTSTVKCPTNSAGICFGSNCSGPESRMSPFTR